MPSSYVCGGAITSALLHKQHVNPENVFFSDAVSDENRLDYCRGLDITADEKKETIHSVVCEKDNNNKRKRATFAEEEKNQKSSNSKKINKEEPQKEDEQPREDIIFCAGCFYHCPVRNQPRPFPQELPKPPTPVPPPERNQLPMKMKFPSAYLGDVEISVIPRGMENFEMIGDTREYNGENIIMKIIDSQTIPNFNANNPPSAPIVSLAPAHVINLSQCLAYKSVLNALRYKKDRTPSEEVQFFQGLVYLCPIDAMFLMGNMMQSLKENFGLLNITYNNLMMMNAVMDIKNLDNAFAFYGSNIFIGNGETYFYPLACVDIIGHELGHVIISKLNGLIYQGEAGAINESIADVFGLFFERWLYFKFNSDTNKDNDLMGSFNYTIGEQCGKKMRIMRNMENPRDSPQPQPSRYKDELWKDPNSPIDYGFVHGNSGVGNFLAFNLIQSLGWEIAGKLLFESWKLLKTTSNYCDYRDALKTVATNAQFNCLQKVQVCLNTVGLTDDAFSTWIPKAIN